MKKQKYVAVLMIAALLAAGCGSSKSSTEVGNGTNQSADAAGNAGENSTADADSSKNSSGDSGENSSGNSGENSNGDSSGGAADSGSASKNASSFNASEMFTDRDYRTDYKESESAVIKLNDNSASCSSNAVQISGSTVTITDEGTYILSGALEDGMIIVNADKTDKLQIVLDGVTVHSKNSAAIYIQQADKVFLTTAEGSVNTLSNGGQFTAIDENNIDAVIFSKEDLTLNGNGSLAVNSPAGHGIVSKDDLAVTSGAYDITAASHGLSGRDSVRIADGSITISSGKDGIHASNTDDDSKGFCYIAGGTYEIAAEDDGIHADAQLVIKDGDINITKSYEGIEGKSIEISGGNIALVSKDDGLNAAGGNDQSGFGGFHGNDNFASDSDCYISISGGVLNVDASGDGIDSNGSLTVSGGEIYVSGPTDGGNGALDYNAEAVITGGIVVAAGSSQMAENFGSSSTQGTMLVTVGAQPAGSTIELAGSSGKKLVSWKSGKAFESVLISCPEIVSGADYTLTAGSFQTQVTMDSLVYGSGSGMGGRGNKGGMGGRKDMGGMGGRDGMYRKGGMEDENGMGGAGGTYRKGGMEDENGMGGAAEL